MPSPCPPLRCASLHERARLRAWVCAQHVEASSFSPASRAAQIADLDDDFPDLASDAGWASLALASWVVEDASGELLGAAGLKVSSSRADAVELSYLFVSPTARGRGIGRALLRAAVAHARAMPSVRAVRLLTLEGIYDTAMALYASEGFKEYAPRTLTPEGHYTLVFMELAWDGDGHAVPVVASALALSAAVDAPVSPLPLPPPLPSPREQAARQHVVEWRVTALAGGFFCIFAAYSTAQLLQSSVNGSAGLACLFSVYMMFAASSLCAPAAMAALGPARLSPLLAASALPYVAMTAANLLPGLPLLLLCACASVGVGGGTLWGAQGVFMGLAASAHAAGEPSPAVRSASASRLNTAFYSIFMLSGGVSNAVATIIMLALPDPAAAVDVLFSLLAVVATGGALLLLHLPSPDAPGEHMLLRSDDALRGSWLLRPFGGGAWRGKGAGSGGDGRRSGVSSGIVEGRGRCEGELSSSKRVGGLASCGASAEAAAAEAWALPYVPYVVVGGGSGGAGAGAPQGSSVDGVERAFRVGWSAGGGGVEDANGAAARDIGDSAPFVQGFAAERRSSGVRAVSAASKLADSTASAPPPPRPPSAAPSPLFMLRFLASEPRVWCLAPASFTAGASQGFLLGAWMAAAVARGAGPQWVGLAGSAYSLSAAFASRQWGALAQHPAFGRRWAFAAATGVHVAWFAVAAVVWAGGGWEGSAAGAASSAGGVVLLVGAMALYASCDPIWQSLVIATLQHFYPSAPQLQCAMSAPRFFFAVGFASAQALSLSLLAGAGRPCIAEQCALYAALTAGVGASLAFLHTRIEDVDGRAVNRVEGVLEGDVM